MDEKTFNISVPPSELKAVAADLITVEYNNSYVVLSFIQTYEVTKDGDTSARAGTLTGRVMLSWEHFARFYSEMSKFFKATKDKAEKNSKQAFEFVEKMTTVEEDNVQ